MRKRKRDRERQRLERRDAAWAFASFLFVLLLAAIAPEGEGRGERGEGGEEGGERGEGWDGGAWCRMQSVLRFLRAPSGRIIGPCDACPRSPLLTLQAFRRVSVASGRRVQSSRLASHSRSVLYCLHPQQCCPAVHSGSGRFSRWVPGFVGVGDL